MGYTHYFNFNEGVKEFSKPIINDIKTIIEKYKNILVIEEIDNKLLSFNGTEENSYEQFEIGATIIDFNFCKTAKKPYDLPLCEILLILKWYYKDNFNLDSDGFWVGQKAFEAKEIEDNWMQAMENVKEQFNYEFDLNPEISGDKYSKYYKLSIINK